MLPPISTPTDNLYKFMAIVGLITAALSLWYPLDRVDTLNIQIARSNADAARLEVERVSLNSAVEAWQEKAKGVGSPLGMFDLNRGSQEASLKNQSEQLINRKRDYELKIAELTGKRAEINLIKSQLTRWQVIGGIGFLVGIAVGAVGFKNWYYYWQKPQDMANLKRE